MRISKKYISNENQDEFETIFVNLKPMSSSFFPSEYHKMAKHVSVHVSVECLFIIFSLQQDSRSSE